MSTSKRTFTVVASDDMAELTVVDGSLNTVARGVAKLQASLPVGLYKIRARVGPTITEQLVSLDQDVQINIPELSIPSPIPLGASPDSVDHAPAAITASTTVTDSFGVGASVLIFAREASRSQGDSGGSPAAGLFLLNEQGQQLADIEQRAETRRGTNACAGWRADVDPGPYRLRLVRPDGTAIERAIYAVQNDQIQVFLLQGDYILSDGTVKRIPDMSGSAIAISTYHGFNPQSRLARLSEIARYALTQRRRILSDAFLNHLLDEKFDDPMLGLLGAHLLLRDNPDDSRLFQIVTGNLRRLLGPDHPDLRALWLARKSSDGSIDLRLESPPMLRQSWDLAVDKSILNPDILAVDAPGSSIADKILPDAPWLLWRTSSGDQLSAVEHALKDYLGARARAEVSRAAAAPRSVFKRLTTTFNELVAHESAAPPPSLLDSEEKADLIRTLGVPDKVLQSMLDKLSR
jgi:hypothetical protein